MIVSLRDRSSTLSKFLKAVAVMCAVLAATAVVFVFYMAKTIVEASVKILEVLTSF